MKSVTAVKRNLSPKSHVLLRRRTLTATSEFVLALTSKSSANLLDFQIHTYMQKYSAVIMVKWHVRLKLYLIWISWMIPMRYSIRRVPVIVSERTSNRTTIYVLNPLLPSDNNCNNGLNCSWFSLLPTTLTCMRLLLWKTTSGGYNGTYHN